MLLCCSRNVIASDCILQGMEPAEAPRPKSGEFHTASKSRRNSLGSTLWKEGRNALLRSQTAGIPAFSLVPLAKVSAINAEISQKIYSLPAAPGATALSCAVAVVGMQVGSTTHADSASLSAFQPSFVMYPTFCHMCSCLLILCCTCSHIVLAFTTPAGIRFAF